MTNRYQEQIKKIKVPIRLKEQTKKLMEQVEEHHVTEDIIDISKSTKKIIKSRYTNIILSVAIICIVFFSGYYFMQNNYSIEEVEMTEFNITPKLGNYKFNKGINNITETSIKLEDEIPIPFEKVSWGKLKGREVKLIKDKNDYYALIKKEKELLYVKGIDIDEKEFLNYLKRLK